MTRSPGARGRDIVTPASLSPAAHESLALLAVLHGNRAYRHVLARAQLPGCYNLVTTADGPPDPPRSHVDEERREPRPVPAQEASLDAPRKDEARRRISVPECGEW